MESSASLSARFLGTFMSDDKFQKRTQMRNDEPNNRDVFQFALSRIATELFWILTEANGNNAPIAMTIAMTMTMVMMIMIIGLETVTSDQKA